jgi:hypothetical protein
MEALQFGQVILIIQRSYRAIAAQAKCGRRTFREWRRKLSFTDLQPTIGIRHERRDLPAPHIFALSKQDLADRGHFRRNFDLHSRGSVALAAFNRTLGVAENRWNSCSRWVIRAGQRDA